MSISAAASAFLIATTTIRRPRRSNTPRSSPSAQAALGCKVILEPGRVIVGNAGALVASVIYLKKGENKHFVIVDAAMNDLVRPTLYDAHHEILPVKEPAPGAYRMRSDVVGPVCESGDYLALDRDLPELGRGRPHRGDERRRLRRRAGRNLQFPPPRSRGAGERRGIFRREAEADL